MSEPDQDTRRALVIVVDLRTEYDTVMAAQRFADIQTAYARTRVPAGTMSVDADRVLVLDDAADLVAHRDAYERIFAGMYSKVVCVAVGSPVDGTVVLRRPGQLAGTDAATLWVGDVRGTQWAPGRAPGVTLSPDDADALVPLLDVLTQPEVFDQVLRTVTDMPKSIASPGMNVFVHRIRDDAVQRARVRAAQRLAGTEGGVDEPWPEPLASLADGKGAPAAAAGARECVRPDGAIGVKGAHAHQVFGRARERVASLARPLALYTVAGRRGRPLDAEIADAGGHLYEYRELVRQTVNRGAAGFDADGRAWLEHVGVVVPEAPGLDTASVAGAMRERVALALDRQEGLRGLSERVRELADRMGPGPASTRTGEAEQACTDGFLTRYARPASFPATPANPAVVAAVVVGAFLAGLWPAFGIVGAVLAVLIAVGGQVAIALRRPDREGRGALPAASVSSIVASTLTGIVGGVAGVVAGRAWDPPMGVGPLALVLGLALLLALPGVDWTLRVRAWERALDLGGATRALAALHGVLVRTVWNDWALAGPRREAVDRAIVLAALLEEAAKSLADDATSIEKQFTGGIGADPDPAPTGAGYRPGYTPPTRPGAPPAPNAPPASTREQAGVSLYETVLGDLVDALNAAFEPLWGLLERDPAEASRRGAQAEVRPVLAAYGDHLAHNGIQAPPSFARRLQERPHVGDAVGGDADRIAELLGQGPERPMLQLCAADEVILLDHVLTHSRSVRFAPRAVGPAVRDALRERRPTRPIDDELVWTGGGRMVGVLRMLPLLPGSVDDTWMWARSDAGDDADAAASDAGDPWLPGARGTGDPTGLGGVGGVEDGGRRT